MKTNKMKPDTGFYEKLLVLFKTGVLLTAIFFASCKEDNITKGREPAPGKPDTLNIPDTIVHEPDTATHRPDSIVNPHDSSVYRSFRVSWVQTDYKEYQYDKHNRLVRYYFQYMFVQNDPSMIKFMDYRYKYDLAGKLIESIYNNKTKTVYEYEGNVLKEAKEFDEKSRQLAQYNFKFNGAGQLVELITNQGNSSPGNALKYTYKYNHQGNLIEMKQYYQSGAQFLLSLTYQWDNFDEQKHLENPASFYPFVQDLRYWKNNPGRRIVRDKNGAQTSFVENYRYTYDSKGNPTSKTTEVIADKSFYSTCYYTYKNW